MHRRYDVQCADADRIAVARVVWLARILTPPPPRSKNSANKREPTVHLFTLSFNPCSMCSGIGAASARGPVIYQLTYISAVRPAANDQLSDCFADQLKSVRYVKARRRLRRSWPRVRHGLNLNVERIAETYSKPIAPYPTNAPHQRTTVKLEMNFFTLRRYGATSARAEAARRYVTHENCLLDKPRAVHRGSENMAFPFISFAQSVPLTSAVITFRDYLRGSRRSLS